MQHRQELSTCRVRLETVLETNLVVEALNPDMKFALWFVQKCTFLVVSSIIPEESRLELKNELVAEWIKESERDTTSEG